MFGVLYKLQSDKMHVNDKYKWHVEWNANEMLDIGMVYELPIWIKSSHCFVQSAAVSLSGPSDKIGRFCLKTTFNFLFHINFLSSNLDRLFSIVRL
jgi:hypothetical protein